MGRYFLHMRESLMIKAEPIKVKKIWLRMSLDSIPLSCVKQPKRLTIEERITRPS